MAFGVAAVSGNGFVKQRALSGISVFLAGTAYPSMSKDMAQDALRRGAEHMSDTWLLPCTVIGGCIADALLLCAALTL